MYRQWGGDIINMSVIPEAKLARECEIECVPHHTILHARFDLQLTD